MEKQTEQLADATAVTPGIFRKTQDNSNNK
jgi:hypothetical protein